MGELLEIIKQQAAVNQQLTNELALLREQVAYLTQKLYGKHEKKGITLYHHDKHRSGLVVKEFLGDYAGYVHCDMLRQ